MLRAQPAGRVGSVVAVRVLLVSPYRLVPVRVQLVRVAQVRFAPFRPSSVMDVVTVTAWERV